MKKIIKNPLSNRIKELREERKWTQMQLAKEAGLAKPLISMIETGERFPSDDVLKKLRLDDHTIAKRIEKLLR